METTREYLTGEVEVSETPTVPDGTYTATLVGVREEEHQEYGQRRVWDWTLPEMHPDGSDFNLMVWTPPRFSSTGIASEMARALGFDTSKGARFDIGELRGRTAMLAIILDLEKSRNRVRAATPATPARPAAETDPDFVAYKAAKAAQAAGPAPRSSVHSVPITRRSHSS